MKKNLVTDKNAFSLRGDFFLFAHYKDGEKILVEYGCNIVTDNGLALVVSILKGVETPFSSLAIGTGDESWDINPPVEDAETSALNNELINLSIEMKYWDDVNGQFSITPTNVLDIRAIADGSIIGDLREWGIKGGGSDILYNHAIHGKIPKTDDYNLEYIIRIYLERKN